MTVYKYCDRRGVDILNMLRLKVTRPEEFNDPFEFTAAIVGELSEAQAEELFADEKFVRWQLDILEERGGSFPGGYDAFRKILADPFCREKLAREFPPQHRETMRRLARENVNQVSQQFAVLCVSTVTNNIVMWSHYADKHRGIVIGFDSDHSQFAARKWFAVKYAKDRVAVDVAWTLRKAEASDGMPSKVFKTKSEAWSYEKELRSIFKLSDLESSVSNDGRVYFWKIAKEAIVEVRLGHRCLEATENSVREAIKISALDHVRLERADLDDRHFALVFRPA